MNGCKFCKNDESKEYNVELINIEEKNAICDILIQTYIYNDYLITNITPDKREPLINNGIKIKYCPMCGRKLDEENN